MNESAWRSNHIGIRRYALCRGRCRP